MCALTGENNRTKYIRAMKKLLFSLLLLCLPIPGTAQTEKPDIARIADSKDSLKISKFRKIIKMPEFPGGKKALYRFLNKKIRWPMYNRDSGTVLVRFIVSKTGKIEDIVVLQSLNRMCDIEAVRLIKSMPDWTPGQIDGKNANTYFTIPITFTCP